MSCRGYASRHWYSFYGMPGYRSPVCVRCGHPNPRPLSEAEWGELLQLRADPGLRLATRVWAAARPAFDAALAAHQAVPGNPG